MPVAARVSGLWGRGAGELYPELAPLNPIIAAAGAADAARAQQANATAKFS